MSPPFRLLSNDGEIGYSSAEAGLVAPLYDASTADKLKALLANPPQDKPAVLLAQELLSPSTMQRLRTAAAAVILQSRKLPRYYQYPPGGFSPQETDPNRRCQRDVAFVPICTRLTPSLRGRWGAEADAVHPHQWNPNGTGMARQSLEVTPHRASAWRQQQPLRRRPYASAEVLPSFFLPSSFPPEVAILSVDIESWESLRQKGRDTT